MDKKVCQKCNIELIMSDKHHFDIQKKWLPTQAQRMSIANLVLWICRHCGLMEVHHKQQGYQGTYGVLWHEFWYTKFRHHQITTMLEADQFYTEEGYRGFLSRSSFIRDFKFQKTSWSEHKGPKAKEINPDQNVIFT